MFDFNNLKKFPEIVKNMSKEELNFIGKMIKLQENQENFDLKANILAFNTYSSNRARLIFSLLNDKILFDFRIKYPKYEYNDETDEQFLYRFEYRFFEKKESYDLVSNFALSVRKSKDKKENENISNIIRHVLAQKIFIKLAEYGSLEKRCKKDYFKFSSPNFTIKNMEICKNMKDLDSVILDLKK